MCPSSNHQLIYNKLPVDHSAAFPWYCVIRVFADIRWPLCSGWMSVNLIINSRWQFNLTTSFGENQNVIISGFITQGDLLSGLSQKKEAELGVQEWKITNCKSQHWNSALCTSMSHSAQRIISLDGNVKFGNVWKCMFYIDVAAQSGFTI